MEKTYTLPDGTKFIFEYDHNRMGIITLECVDTLMSLLKATTEQTEPQTDNGIGCSKCESRFWCMDRDMPHAVHCNNYGKTEQTERSE